MKTLRLDSGDFDSEIHINNNKIPIFLVSFVFSLSLSNLSALQKIDAGYWKVLHLDNYICLLAIRSPPPVDVNMNPDAS